MSVLSFFRIAMIRTMLLLIAMLGLTSGQFGSGGGPSTFGYDGSSACTKPYSRYSRARFEKLPCDFRRQNWCTVAGSAYPWHAVRRFVQENQGLMRRMYGDERHINILKADLEKNDIELEYEDRYQPYPEESRRFQYVDEYEFVNLENEAKFRGPEYASQARGFTGEIFESEPMMFSDRNRKHTKNSVEYTSPKSDHDTTTTTTSGTTTTTTSTTSTTTTTPRTTTTTIVPNSSEAPIEPKNRLNILSSTTMKTLASSSTSGQPDSVAVDSTTERRRPIESGNSTMENLEKNDSPSAPAVTLADIATIKNSSINEIPGQSERLKEHPEFDRTELPDFLEVSSDQETTAAGLEATTGASTIDRIGEADLEDDFKDSSFVGDEIFAASSQQEPQQQFRPRPEYRPAESKPETASIEGQLFQDVAAKDQQEQPVLKLRGVNACPVKEEVVAPFWANNTRGEVLALLNLYPFEQYVHWEKCTHENKQMYCRDGCRCEQQYRLHRLLAYDPNNECRGIFSDWFKFPSCCVCRCYDLPVEFRVTSRSPRMQKEKVRLRPPGYQRG